MSLLSVSRGPALRLHGAWLSGFKSPNRRKMFRGNTSVRINRHKSWNLFINLSKIETVPCNRYNLIVFLSVGFWHADHLDVNAQWYRRCLILTRNQSEEVLSCKCSSWDGTDLVYLLHCKWHFYMFMKQCLQEIRLSVILQSEVKSSEVLNPTKPPAPQSALRFADWLHHHGVNKHSERIVSGGINKKLTGNVTMNQT